MATHEMALDTRMSNETAGRKRVWTLLAIAVLCWLPVLFGRDAVQAAAALYPLSQTGYFVGAHAFLLYFWTPLVVASACALLLSPGLFLSIALDGAPNPGQWILTALGISIVAIGGLTTVAQSLAGPLTPGAFLLLVVICSAAAFVFLLLATIMEGGNPASFINIPAFLIVGGGTAGATLASCDISAQKLERVSLLPAVQILVVRVSTTAAPGSEP